jgi:hypothetical protein
VQQLVQLWVVGDQLVLGAGLLVGELEKQGMMVLVPKQNPTARISLVVCLGRDGSLLRVSQMFQDSMYYFI